jgi:hypothetical protein
MTSTAADDLRTNVIGAWKLQSYESRSIDGSNVTYPLGVDAEGIIMYTADGYMSAQLMRSGRSPSSLGDAHPDGQDELAAPPVDISATRAYTVVGDDLIAHDVLVSLLPQLDWRRTCPLSPHRRLLLELSPPEPILIRGEHQTPDSSGAARKHRYEGATERDDTHTRMFSLTTRRRWRRRLGSDRRRLYRRRCLHHTD